MNYIDFPDPDNDNGISCLGISIVFIIFFICIVWAFVGGLSHF